MFDCKIKFESNEVLKNELFASIVPGEARCKLSNVNDLNLAGTFEKSIFNKNLLPKVKDSMGIKANAVLESTDEGNNTEPPNSDPNQAYPINMDVMYNDSITGKGKRRWYYFQLTEKKKVTAYMSPVADVTVDNDLDLYKLDTTNGTLSVIAQSQNPSSHYELLSYVAEPGYYFLSVAAFAGEIANQFSFMVRLSDKWDENEADDSLLQAKVQPFSTPVKHTLDNSIDQDLSIVNVSEAGYYTFTLEKVPDNVNYQLEILNKDMQLINSDMRNISIVSKNSSKVFYLDVNSYILRLASVDGSNDTNNECIVSVSIVDNEQPIFTPVKHSIKNNINLDLSLINTSEAGNYSFTLMQVPDNVNYQLEILNKDMQLINSDNNNLSIVGKNSSKVIHLDVDNYIIHLVSADGSVDPNAECIVLVSLIPNEINAYSKAHYLGIMTNDNKHFVEIMSLANLETDRNPILGVSIDGQAVDVSHVNFTATRYNTSHNESECDISTSKDTRIIGAGICSAYFGSNQKSNIGIKNRLFLSLSIATYAESHYQMDGNKNIKRWANVRPIPQGKAEIILDMDTMNVVDLFMPNWYFGDASICGYPSYGNKETPGIDFSTYVGTLWLRE